MIARNDIKKERKEENSLKFNRTSKDFDFGI